MKCPECQGPSMAVETAVNGCTFAEPPSRKKQRPVHEHQKQVITRRCPQGHEWTVTRRLGCRVPGCDWTEEPRQPEHELEVPYIPLLTVPASFWQRLRRRFAQKEMQ